jgi:hypothetical protein
MYHAAVEDSLLVTLAHSYEEDPGQFVTLPKPVVDSSVTRLAVAELRNEGYVEEFVRGVVRLTARGYQMLQKN